MSEKTLIFRKVNIIRTPGFNPPGFSVDVIEPQINIIFGPNAAGKTTTARVFNCLLWPEKATPANTFVQGEFELEGSKWFVELDSGRIFYQRDGSRSLRPSLPPAEHRDRYYIALHDLLQENTEDKGLAEIIIRESAGGYQISESIQELGFKETPSRKGKNTREANKKIREYQKTVQEQKELLVEEQRLDELYRELAEIKSAQKQLEIARQAVEYAEADKEYRIIKDKYEQFPEIMDKVSGDEIDRLKEIEEDIRMYSEKKKEAEGDAVTAREVLKIVNLADKGIKDGFFTEVKNKNELLKSREEKINILQGEIIEAETKRKEEEKNFIDLVNKDKLKDIDGSAYNELSDFARRAEEINNRLGSLVSLKKYLLTDNEITGKKGIIEAGIRCLEKWLSSPVNNREEEKKTRKISLISGVIISIISIYMGLSINHLFFIIMIVSVFILWYGLGKANIKRDYREEARQEFEQLGLVLPSEWEQSEVKQRLRELRELVTDIYLYISKKQYWQDLSSEYSELQEKQKMIKKEREGFIERFGSAPDSREQTLYYFTNRLSRWQDAYSEYRSLKNKLKEINKDYIKLKDNINIMLKEYDYPPAENSAEISNNITDLEERNSKFKEAARNLKDAEGSMRERDKKIKKALEQKKEIFTVLNLEERDEDKLRELCEQYEEYLGIKKKLSNVEHQRNIEKIKLEEYNEFDPQLSTKDKAELKEEVRTLQTKVENYETVFGKISNIKAKINTARENGSVEEVFASRERALDKLQADLESDYEKVAGYVLADFISEVNTNRNRPQVFQKAREIFADITRGNYRLEISNDKSPVFRAIDTVAGRGKSLDELSSGTRIQLLMAVRMAFIDQEEGGLILPIYLDETLANSDDSRAKAIIESVIELTRKGRQCFYFTAQQDEVKKWVSILEREDDIEYNIVNLGECLKNDNTLKIADISGMAEIISDVEQIPEPGKLSHKEYGEKLSISNFSPRQGAGSAHIWYFVEDTELIKYFLEMGIFTWGQLKTLLVSRKDFFVPAEKRKLLPEIKKLGCCLEEFVDCWKVGRGKPVDRSVLMATEAVSDNFMDEVSRLAEEVNGDAEAIIEELQNGAVARFLTKKIQELEEYFLEEGYLASEEKLSGEQIYARMLSVISSDNTEQSGRKVRRLLKRLNR